MGREDQGVAASKSRYQVVPRTLCFVRHGDEVLLLKGAPNKRIWANRYNGLGGHVERGEDVLSATLREVQEEAGLEVRDPRLVGIVHADAGDPQIGILFFIFTAWSDSKEVIASPEGELEWRGTGDLPVSEMAPDLPVVLPGLLALSPGAGALFLAYTYDENDQLVIHFAEPGP
jgi:8-oxo-dGTP diphosphatase